MQIQSRSTDQCHVSNDEVESTLRGVSRYRIYLGAALVVLFLLAFSTLIRAWSEKAKERSAVQQIEDMGGKVLFAKTFLKLTQIARKRSLYAVDLVNIDFSGKDLSCLQDLDNLLLLDLQGSQNLDELLRYATLAPSLRTIRLGETDVTAAGLAELSGKKSLDSLTFHKARWIDAAMFSALLKIPNLGFIDLSGAEFNHDEFEILSQHPKLQYLHLYGTKLSDSDVDLLATFTNLKFLNLNNTRFTNDGISALQRKLPHTDIPWESISD